tara:strand:- start:126 stop:353 length:228 start_codon:yes stop_codon:yes gene_type:complete
MLLISNGFPLIFGAVFGWRTKEPINREIKEAAITFSDRDGSSWKIGIALSRSPQPAGSGLSDGAAYAKSTTEPTT